MLGMRGIRLAINFPEVYEMQVRAVIGAAADSGRDGEPPILEIMLPLIAYEAELDDPRATGSRRWPRRRCARPGSRSSSRSGR